MPFLNTQLRRISFFALCAAGIISPAGAQTHPRLFFDSSAVAGYQAKANTAPWSDMLASIESAITLQVADGDGNQPTNYAALHLFRGSSAAPNNWSDKAKWRVLEWIANQSLWSTSASTALTRGAYASKTAITYDLCYNAWVGQTVPATFTSNTGATITMPTAMVGLPVNTVVSQALKTVADSLIATGGSGWPGDSSISNNWFGVRYGGAGTAYLACDETGTDANFSTAVSKLTTYLKSNLGTDPKGMGWGVEGIGYTQYPGYTVYPFAISYKRLKNQDLVAQVPGMKLSLWSTYFGALPISRYSRLGAPGETGTLRGLGLGLRPDFEDDHDIWLGEGTAALAFAFAPVEYLPGLKWQFRRLAGDLGDRTWDVSTGNGLFSLLYYPDAVTEQNPSQVWGNTYADDSTGVYIFRNRFQDDNDFVLQTKANFRVNNGGHDGPDSLSFRLWGLGVPWAVGSGRTYDMRGQTSFFADDPSTASTPAGGMLSSLVDSFQRVNGDGYVILNMETTDTGVYNQTRRLLADYSGTPGAPGVFIISDTSDNGRYWRLNTPDFNTITTSTGEFTITAPTGEKLRGKVLWPLNAAMRTGTFTRGNAFAYKDVNWNSTSRTYSTHNKWVDFQTSDGKVVIVLTVIPSGGTQPAVSATGTGDNQVVTVGGRVYTIAGNAITVAGWSKPSLTITSPGEAQNYNAGVTNIAIAGTASDPDTISRVEIWLDDVYKGAATLSGSNWSYTLGAVPLGAHKLEVVAYDSVNDHSSVVRNIKVNTTVPPECYLTYPARTSTLQTGQTLVLQGRASDAEGGLNRVEIWANGAKLGNATLNVAASTWTYTWSALPLGRHTVYALAYDNVGDTTQTDSLLITGSLFFSTTPFWGDAASFVVGGSSANTQATFNGNSRWSTREDGGDLRLRLKAFTPYDYTLSKVTLATSSDEQFTNFRLTYKLKMDEALTAASHAYLYFGRGTLGSPLTLDLRNTNGVLPQYSWSTYSGKGTRIWDPVAGGSRTEIAWSLNSHAPTDSGYPNAAATDKAGLPGAGWQDVRVDRFGKRMMVYVNNALVLDTTTGLLGTKGSLAFANESNAGSPAFYDDVNLVPLDASGNLVSNTAATFAVTTPAAFADLASGSAVTLAGTVSDPEGVASVNVYLGARLLGAATLNGSAWSLPWTAATGTFALWSEVTDNAGNVTRTAPRVFTVTASGGAGGNASPAITIGPDNTVTTALGLTGSVSDAEGPIALVQIFRDGVLVGTAMPTGNTWKFQLSGLAQAGYAFTARAFDQHGNTTTTAPYNVTIQAPTVTVTSPAGGNATVNQPITLSATATDDGSVTSVEFFVNGISVGQGSFNGSAWTLQYTPAFYGAISVTATARDNFGTTATTPSAATATVVPDAGVNGALVTYLGGTGQQELSDVMELSDGTFLVAGSASDLAWTSATKTQLAAGTIPARATGRTAFLMRLSSDLQTVLGVWHLPAGQVLNIRWIKSTSKPGQPTGSLYISGQCDATSGDYFIAKLNNNFVAAAPTAFSWTRVARQSSAFGDNLGLQTWDVGGDGRVAYVDETGETIRVFFVDAANVPMKLAGLRGSHWATGVTLNDANRQAAVGSAVPAATISGISFPADLRSWTDPDRLAILPDENGGIKRGTWPMDLFTAVQDKDGGTVGTIEYGYTGYKSAGKYRIGGITVDRDTNDFYLGFNIQSRFWDATNLIEQPDFEPAVIAYSATGALKWWNRLYAEVVDANANSLVDAGETRQSSPDQYVDGLALDYSATPVRLVVAARCHGNNTSNFWSANTIAVNPGGSGFQNAFTGVNGNIHLSWLGKFRVDTGALQRATFHSGYLRDTVLAQAAYPEAIHDNWPSHKAGFPDLNTTTFEPGSLRTDVQGRVYTIGYGARMVTTFNAHQKIPKITASVNEGTSPWAANARVYDADLVTLVYSSAFTGAWTYPSVGAEPVGADNTTLRGVFPTANGMLVAGYHNATASVADGNAVPVNKVPSWGRSTPLDQTGLFARLPFTTSANFPPSVSAIAAQTTAPGSPTSALTFTLSDVETAAADLTVSAASSNPVLVPSGGFTFGGSGSSRTLTVTPAAGEVGTATITVTVNDGTRTASTSFVLTVSAGANTAPVATLTGPANNAAYLPGATVPLAATATDANGSIVRVDFYVNGTRVNQDSTSPYAFDYTAPAQTGIYEVFARAVDDGAATADSATARIYIGTRSALPGITQAAAASPAIVTGTTTALSVNATDSDDAANTLAYTWSQVSGPSGGTTSFSASGSNSARTPTATFTRAGTYVLAVTVTDSTLGSTTSQVTVTVSATPTTVTVTPGSAGVIPSQTFAFSATVRDQFGQTLTPAITWSASSGGTINSSGLFTAGASFGGPHTVTATAGGISGTATVRVLDLPPGLLFIDQFIGDWGTGLSAYNANHVLDIAPTGGTVLADLGTPGLSIFGRMSDGATSRWSLVHTNGAAMNYRATNSADFIASSTTVSTTPYTFYASALVRYSQLDLSGSSIGVDVPITFAGNPNTVRFGLINSSGTVRAFVSRGGSNPVLSSATILPDTTYHIVVKWSWAGAASSSFVAATYGVEVNPVVGTEPAWAMSANGQNSKGPLSLGSVSFGTWLPAHSGGTVTARAVGQLDEIRVGTTYASVVQSANRPEITVAPAASPAVINGGSTNLSVTAADPDDAESALTYTWAALTVPPGGSVTFGANGTNAAKSSSATFTASGAYTLQVTVADPLGHAVSGTVNVTVTQATGAPVITQVATALLATVAGNSTVLSVVAGDSDDGESALTYTWSAPSRPVGATVTFGDNGTNAAKSTSVSFDRAGAYLLKVTVADPTGKTAESTVSVTVRQTPQSLTINPANSTLYTRASTPFSVTGLDQFGQALSAPNVNWSASGGGTISAAGLFTAGSTAGGPFTITATSGSVQATASVTLQTAPLPNLVLPATSVTQQILANTAVTRPFRITNTGGAPLSYALTLPAAPTNYAFSRTSAQSPGPGYSWVDTSTGTALWTSTADDETKSVTFPSGFTFPFYGVSYSSVNVCTNGFINFGTATNSYNNLSLPSTSAPRSLIAVLWRDLYLDSASWVRWKLMDADTLAITWNNVYPYGYSNERITFQVLLKRSGAIIIQVKSHNSTSRFYTVGLQNQAGTSAYLLAYNPATAYIPVSSSASNFAVQIAPMNPWLAATPTEGSVAAGASTDVSLAFDATGFPPGVNPSGTVLLACNDADTPTVNIPVTMDVLSTLPSANPPAGLTATAITTTSIDLAWMDSGGGRTGYTVESKIGVGGPWTTLASPAADATTHSATGLTANTTYFFRIKALRTGASDSAYSDEASAATPSAADTAPTISSLGGQSIAANAVTTALALTIGDAQTAAASLTLTGTSSNSTLVPTANIVFGGAGANRTITITPAANQAGTSTITVTVSDGTLTAQTSFNLTVTPNFTSWLSAYPGIGSGTAAGDDPDHDGLANLLEYALGSDPSAVTSPPSAQVVSDNGQNYLQIQWTSPADRVGITTVGQTSANLSAWSSAAGDVTTTIVPATPGFETITIRDLSPLATNPRRFLRIVVTPQ